MANEQLTICEKDRVRIKDLIVSALGGIPVETIQRLVEQVMEIPDYGRKTIVDQAFQNVLTSMVRNVAQEWAEENKSAIHSAILKALNDRQKEILENVTSNVYNLMGDLNFTLSVTNKRRT
jgi:FixJ family two-component response regulator